MKTNKPTEKRYAVELDCWRSTRTLYATRSRGIVTGTKEHAAKYRSAKEADYKAKQYAPHNPRVVILP